MRRSLHLGLLVAVLATGCGEEEEPPQRMCWEDSDCSGGKFCGFDDRYGAERCLGTGSNGESGNGGSGDTGGNMPPRSDACGSSPLNGKYLWEVNSCRSGAITPGDPETCTFQYRDEDGRIFLLHYNGLDLGPNKLVREVHYSSSMISLCQSFAEEMRREVERTNCTLSLAPRLYILWSEGDCFIGNYDLITDRPYDNLDSCRSDPEVIAFARRSDEEC